MKNPILSIKNLVFESNKKTNILNIKKFEIHRGACYLLSGSMSSGKTLLLDMMSGNNSKYSGEIFYEDKLISKHPKNIINSEFASSSIILNLTFFNFKIISVVSVETPLIVENS